MNISLFLIRHGDVENPEKKFYGREVNVSLSNKGREQIRRLGVYFAKERILPGVIFSSPLLRTVETATILQKSFATKIPLHTTAALHETASKGFLGITVKLMFSFGDIYQKPPAFVTIEHPEAIAKRMQRFFDRTVKKYGGKTVFFVSHGDPLAFFLSSLLTHEKPLPSIVWLREHRYLQKGEAWKVIFKEGESSVSYEKVRE